MSKKEDNYADVTVCNGIVRGKIYKDERGNHEYYSFTGVPYAKPPIGELRFEEPQPCDNWKGIKDATDRNGAKFSQYNVLTNSIEGEEELLLNIYTPSLPTKSNKEKLPVMVYIHQGGFMWGSSCKDEFGPDFLIKNDVIVVTMTYRLNIFGFLCLDIPKCPGNNGLKDQVMGLQWVNQNIASFNGDPANVTIFGSSAGGASVHYHLLSPLSKGLFHKASMQSGTALSHWAFRKNPVTIAHAIAKILNITFNSNEDLFNILKQTSSKDLLMAVIKIPSDAATLFHPFLPVAEKKFDGVKNFLTEDPITLMEKGKFTLVPTMIGICEVEAHIIRKIFPEPYDEIEKNNNPEKLLNLGLNKSQENDLKDDAIKAYGDVRENLSRGYIGDYDFGSGFFYTANSISSKNPNTYAYQFSYVGGLNYTCNFTKMITTFDQATHLDDLGYLVSATFIPKDAMPIDIYVKENMLRMWTNFAKHGNPTPKTDDVIKTIWPPVKHKEFNCLNIGSEISILTNAFEKRRKLWEYIYNYIHNLKLQ